MSPHLYNTVQALPIKEQIRCLQIMIKNEWREKYKRHWEQELVEVMKKEESSQESQKLNSQSVPMKLTEEQRWKTILILAKKFKAGQINKERYYSKKFIPMSEADLTILSCQNYKN